MLVSEEFSRSHDPTTPYTVPRAGAVFHLLSGDRNNVCLAQFVGGKRNRHVVGRAHGLPDGWDNYVPAVN